MELYILSEFIKDIVDKAAKAHPKESEQDVTNETIQNLLFRSEPEEKKFPIYRSKFSKQVREEVKNRKDCHKTFGLPKEMLAPTPLKKGTRRVVRPEVDKTKPDVPLKMKIPPKPDWNRPAHRDHSNFLLRNMIYAVRLRPPQGPSRAFDSASGRRFHACNLLVPKFSLKEDFGKVPKYLEERKKKLAEEEEVRRKEEHERRRKEAEEALLSDEEDEEGADIDRSAMMSSSYELSKEKRKRGPVFREIPQEERAELLFGLKKSWEELTKEFKLLPTIVDSVPMIKKKRHLEQVLDTIEKDIDLLERHKHIYVYKNNSPCCKDFRKQQIYL